MAGTASRGRGWADTWAAPALVAVVAALVFLRSLWGGFVWDDHRFIAENPSVVHPTSWLRFLTDAHTVDNLGAAGLVRPFRTIEFALDYALFGDSPSAFHVHSLLWHVAASALLCLLLRRLLGDGRAAVVAALFWALNPVQAECVAFISSRGDVAMSACVFASALFALKAEGFDRNLAASLAAALVAMMYKETAIVLPAVIIVLRITKLSRVPWWPHVAASGAFLGYWLCVKTGGVSHGVPFEIGGSWLGTVATMCRGFGFYVVEGLLPAESLEWYMSPSTSFADAAVLAWLAVHAAIVVSAVATWRRAPLWTLAVAWFYAFLALTSNVLVSLGVPTFERFLCPALAGVALALGSSLVRAPRGTLTAALVAVSALAVGAVHRTLMWRDDDTLWTNVLADHESPRGRNFKGAAARGAALALRDQAKKLPQGDERAAMLARTKALLEVALDHAHRAIALRYEFERLPRSPTQVTRYSESLASNLCHMLLREDEALFHAELAVSEERRRGGGPMYLDDIAEFDRASPLLALGFAPQAADAVRRALKLGFPKGGEDVGLLFLGAAVKCENDGMPAAAERCYVDAVDALEGGPARDEAQSLLFALRRRPRAVDAEAAERAQIARLDDALARLRPSCPVVPYPPKSQ